MVSAGKSISKGSTGYNGSRTCAGCGLKVVSSFTCPTCTQRKLFAASKNPAGPRAFGTAYKGTGFAVRR